MSQELNVLYQFDNNYAPHAGVSLLSLYENNQSIEKLNVFCAIYNVADDNIKKLDQIANRYGRQITYLDAQNIIRKVETLGGGIGMDHWLHG